MAISWGDGDPKRDVISVVCLDAAGRLREHAKFDNLKEKDLENEFIGIVRRRSPELVVVGGFSANTHKLAELVKGLVLDPEWVEGRKKEGKDIYEQGGFDSREDMKHIPVKYVQDAVARIFQHSKRASEEFGTLPVTTRYCIGLARYAQSPLNEYAALGQDITAITYDQDVQNLVSLTFEMVALLTLRKIPKGKLLMSLERALVNVVNRVGVDINRAVHDPYYQTLLPFVSGLGPRKAQYIVRKVQAIVSRVFDLGT
jgi:transcription elongation factor SPT6